MLLKVALNTIIPRIPFEQGVMEIMKYEIEWMFYCCLMSTEQYSALSSDEQVAYWCDCLICARPTQWAWFVQCYCSL